MSDSDSDQNIRDWTVVGQSGEVESSETDSDYVHLESENVVTYHHQTKDDVATDNQNSSAVPKEELREAIHRESAEDKKVETLGRKDTEADERDEDAESIVSSSGESESLDIEVVSALTDSRLESFSAGGETGDDITDNVEGNLSPSGGEGERILWDENLWFWDDGANLATELSPKRLEKSVSVSSSEIEELEMPGEDEEDEDRTVAEDSEQASGLLPPSVLRLQAEAQASCSDSDHSDIVRIDPPPHFALDHHDSAAAAGDRRTYHGADLMHVSASSSNSSGSSLRSRFHFIHGIPTQHRYVYQRAEEEEQDDNISQAGDVDDRCESDISGVAHDSDIDLSSVSYNVDDLEILEGDVVRSYRHRPNNTLNTLLTALALLTLAVTVGIGLGHYWGTMREVMRRGQQNTRMLEIQDEYLKCLKQQEILQSQVSVTDHEKIAAVTAVWKQKYEELIIEKVDLERTIKQLQGQIEEDISHANIEIIAETDVTRELESQLTLLRSENDQLQVLLGELKERSRGAKEEMDELKASQADWQQESIRQHEQRQDQLQTEVHQLQDAQKRATEDQNHLQTKVDRLTTHKGQVTSTILDMEQEVQCVLQQEASISDIAVKDVFAVSLEECTKDFAIVDDPALSDLMALHSSVRDLMQNNAQLHEQLGVISQSQENQHRLFSSKMELLKDEVNKLANENEDLKATVGKLRYSHQPGATESDDTTLSGDDTEANSDSAEKADINGNDNPASFYDSFQQLVSDYRITELLSNVSQPITEQIEVLKNSTADMHVVETLTQKWSELKDVVENSEAAHRIQKAAEDLREYVMREEQQLKKQPEAPEDAESDTEAPKEESSQETDGSSGNSRRSFRSVVNDITNSTMAVEKYQEFVNKTKQSVNKLTKKIKKTWNKVKNLTGDFLKKNTAIKDFTKTVDKNLKNIGRSVESGWKKARKQLVKKGWLPNSWSSQKSKKNKPRKYQGDPPQQQHTQYPAGQFDSRNSEDNQAVVEQPQTFSHKQKSTTLDHDSYAEYWKQSEFEPDDFFEDGFFQGNNREYKKHQKRVKKLHGRLQRLNEQMFLTMDDDDVEDMYEDFDEVQDDLEEVKHPEILMTWLTCQVRWWKSRLVRKHTNEELVRGCGQHLMHWQLKALCNPPRNKKAKVVKAGPFCDYYHDVILPSSNGALDVKESPRPSFTLTVDENLPATSGEVHNSFGTLRYDISLDGEKDASPKSAKENSTSEAENVPCQDRDASWMFQRAEDRESHHHDGSWNFKRSKGRQHERNKPWYAKRAEQRANKRSNKHPEPTRPRKNRGL